MSVGTPTTIREIGLFYKPRVEQTVPNVTLQRRAVS